LKRQYLFPIEPTPSIAVEDEDRLYNVRRIFCVGRNYEAHAREMGVAVDRDAPFYFTKPASAIVASGASIPYPPGTADYQYEMELVIAIGSPAFRVSVSDAPRAIFGYSCGLDMTRRDLQLEARAKQRPWDLGKAFEQSAVLAPIKKASACAELGPQRIWLKVGGATKQDARLSDLIWGVPEIVSHLSGYYHLGPGDIIFTGTPEGVGPVTPGDEISGGIDGLAEVLLRIGEPEQ
jgi:fumarylpyruvate hydrolase